MAKYYVESGKVRVIFDAANATEAAVEILQWTCDRQAGIESELPLDGLQEALEQDSQLTDEIRVSHLGFRRDDAETFDTLNVVALWQGWLFPWMDGANRPEVVDRSNERWHSDEQKAYEAA